MTAPKRTAKPDLATPAEARAAEADVEKFRKRLRPFDRREIIARLKKRPLPPATSAALLFPSKPRLRKAARDDDLVRMWNASHDKLHFALNHAEEFGVVPKTIRDRLRRLGLRRT